jgi:hypothetical protein
MIAKYFVTGVAASALMATAALAKRQPRRQRAAPACRRRPVVPGRLARPWVVGLKVYNVNNDSVGSIDDLLTDKDGTIKAVVIGVGGLLGVGEHLVAVPFDKIKFVNAPVPSTSASTTPDNATGRPMASTTTGAATTSTVPTGAAPAMTANPNPWYPDHAVFNATKDELKPIPEFKYST